MSGRSMHRLQEFVAHASNVNALHIGRRSGSLLATGGDDLKVNVWAIGKPHALVVRPAFHRWGTARSTGERRGRG